MQADEAPNDGQTEQEHPCSTCFKLIDPRAKKCTECDSYQDWRRFVSISSSVLALLVALVSVVALTTPLMISAWTPDDAVLHVAVQGVAHDKIYLLVSNSGTRAGSVTRATIAGTRWTSVQELALDPAVIRPGEARQFLLVIPGEFRRSYDLTFYTSGGKVDQGELVRVEVQYSNFSGSKARTFSGLIDALDFMEGGDTPWHHCVVSPGYYTEHTRSGKSKVTKNEIDKCPDAPEYITSSTQPVPPDENILSPPTSNPQ